VVSCEARHRHPQMTLAETSRRTAVTESPRLAAPAPPHPPPRP